jgi:DNA-binding NarL/FixJ family response regulator
MTTITILIIDAHAVLRAGLRALLDEHAGLRVVGEAADCATACEIVAAKQPRIVVLGLNSGDESDLDALPEVFAAAPEVRVLVLCGVRDPAVYRRAMMFGAMGLVRKEQPIETVITAIHAVVAGELWLERPMLTSILNYPARPKAASSPSSAEPSAKLTEREREVIRLLGEGLNSQQLAERLVLGQSTVRHHLTSIYTKLGVQNRFELVVYAYQYQLAKLPR